MKELIDSVYDNVVVFPHAVLKLNVPGVTVIRGCNLNTRTKSGKQTNGVGKSVLLSGIADIVNQKSPADLGRKDRWAMLSAKDSRQTFRVRSDGHLYTIIKAASGKSGKYTILKDGVDTDVRTTALAEKYIADTIFSGWSEADFYTRIYLDGRRPFMFQMGTSTQRLEFVTEFWGLNEYDRVRKLLNGRAENIKDNKLKLDTLQSELARAQQRQKASGWDSKMLPKYLSDIKLRERKQKELKALSNRLGQLTTLKAKLDRKKALALQIKKHESVAAGQDLTAILSQLEAHQHWSEYDKAIAVYEATSKKLIAKLARYAGQDEQHADEAAVSKQLRSVEKMLTHLESSLRELVNTRSSLEETIEAARKDYRRLEQRIGPKPPKETPEELQQHAAELKTIIKLGRLLKEGHKQCPTCGSAINAKEIRERANKASSQLERVDRMLLQARSLIELEQIKANGVKLNEELGAAKLQGLDAQRKKLKALRKERDALSAVLESAFTVRDLRAAIKANKKPATPVKHPKRPSSNRVLLEQQQFAWLTAKDLRRQLKKLEADITETTELHGLSLSDTSGLDSTLVKQQKLHDELAALGVHLSERRSLYTEHKTATEQIAELEIKLKKLNKTVADLPVLSALLHAYSNKGLKVLAAQEIARRLEQGFNEQASRIFVEKTKFKVEVGPNSFSILYTRGRRTADVRRLSGAESGCFALLFLAVTTPMTPDKKRCSTVFLDEIDARMSEETRKLFAQDFLPYLQTLIPSIIIATPDTRTPYPGRVLTVTKKGETSSVSEGHYESQEYVETVPVKQGKSTAAPSKAKRK